MNKIAAILIALSMFATYAVADTIYIWTDKKGVKRFSDQPPEGVDRYETEESMPSAPEEPERNGFEKMVQDVKRENQQADMRKEREAAQRRAEDQRKAMEEKNARIQAERAPLQQQIDQLNNRALSPTFTKGMRDHQIKLIREKMDAIE